MQKPSVPAAEQVASIFSLATFSFMSPTLYKAYGLPHLPYNDLPVLADYDRADNLVATSFPSLDPSLGVGKRRYLFFGIMWIYREFCTCLTSLRAIMILTRYACLLLP